MSYYLRNPEAKDTLEGVAQWRLREEEIHHAVADVQQALDWLVERGLLVSTISPGSPPIFGLNRQNQHAAEKFLAQGEAIGAQEEVTSDDGGTA